jgi:hypothetical protein
MTISFDYLIDDSALTNAVDGMLRVYIYDEDKSELIRVNGEDIQLNANAGTHYAQFQTDAASTNYRLVIHNALAIALTEDFTMKIDNVQVGPTAIAHGTIVTDWEEYTPTISGTSNFGSDFLYKRVGDSIKIKGSIGMSGAASGVLKFTLPDGLHVDTSKLERGVTYSDSYQVIGSAIGRDSSPAGYYNGEVQRDNTSTNTFSILTSGDSGLNASWSTTNPFTWASGDNINIEVEVPIQGWSSNAKMSEDLGGREVVVRYNTSSTVLSSSTTDIVFSAKEYDTTNSFDGTTFTAPESGYYSVGGKFRLLNASGWGVGERAALYVFKNGSNHTTLQFWENPSSDNTLTYISASGKTDIYLEKGNTVTLRGSQTSGSSISLDGTDNENYITISKLASAQTILETETVAARYTSSSGQTLASATYTLIKYEENDGDTHNAYDISTGFYTVPVSGWYDIKQVFHLDAAGNNAGETVRCRLSKNNARIAEELYEIDGTNSSSITHGSVQTIVYANKGDLISCEGYQNTDAGAEPLLANSEYNVFTIYRIK